MSETHERLQAERIRALEAELAEIKTGFGPWLNGLVKERDALKVEIKACPNVNWQLYEGKGMQKAGGRESGECGR